MAVKTKKYDQTYDSWANGPTDSPRVIGLNNVYGNSGPSATSNSNNNIYVGGDKNNNSAYPGPTTGLVTSQPTTSSSSKKVSYSGTGGYEYDPFNTSPLTNKYANKLASLEGNKPTWSSRYESTIQSLLGNILNRKAFDINTDVNYNQLYDNYKERYTANAQRAMNDSMASANAMTGGYGSTYGQVAGQQAYDQTMEGLNDRNIDLMNLAYGMYSDDRANDYNKLNTVTGLDDRDYSHYRDDVGDYYTDLNYYANRYDTNYGNDWNIYNTDRSFDYGTFVNDRSFDYQEYSDAVSQANALAMKGLPVPDYLTAVINKYNTGKGYGSGDAQSQLAALAAQTVSGKNPGSGTKPNTTPAPQIVPTSTKPLSYAETTAQLERLKQAEEQGIGTAAEREAERKKILNNSVIGTMAKQQSTYGTDYLNYLYNTKFKTK